MTRRSKIRNNRPIRTPVEDFYPLEVRRTVTEVPSPKGMPPKFLMWFFDQSVSDVDISFTPFDEDGRGFWAGFVDLDRNGADNILSRQHENRNPNRGRNKDYRIMMETGQWHGFGPAGLAISDQGKLMDGQNRLIAIPENGSQRMLMTAGWPIEAHRGIDRGGIRNDRDSLMFEMGRSRTSQHIASLKVVARATKAQSGFRRPRLAVEQVALLDEMFGDRVAEVLTVSRDVYRNATSVGCAVRAGYHGNWNRVLEFFQIQDRPTWEPEDNAPIKTMTMLLRKQKEWSGMARHLLYMHVASAMLAFLERREVRSTRAVSEDPFILPMDVQARLTEGNIDF